VAGVLTGKTEKKLENQLRGGTLTLEWKNDDSPVFMTGSCVQTFTGEIQV
jgi:diaminopimelate epimerase